MRAPPCGQTVLEFWLHSASVRPSLRLKLPRHLGHRLWSLNPFFDLFFHWKSRKREKFTAVSLDLKSLQLQVHRVQSKQKVLYKKRIHLLVWRWSPAQIRPATQIVSRRVVASVSRRWTCESEVNRKGRQLRWSFSNWRAVSSSTVNFPPTPRRPQVPPSELPSPTSCSGVFVFNHCLWP